MRGKARSMSKASIEGVKDALDFLRVWRPPEWRRRTAFGYDESVNLVKCLGERTAAQRLGVWRPYLNGRLTKVAQRAFKEYALAWKATVKEELTEHDTAVAKET